VVSPLVEELCKALVVVLIVQEVNSRYDGLIYGVTAGMGFAMVENLLYSLTAVFGAPTAVEAATTWGLQSLVRGLGSTVGHAVGVGLVGYAIAAYIAPSKRASFGTVGLAYLAAVGLHAGWNGMLVLTEGLSADAGLVASVAIIVLWPLLEIYILVTLMRRGREAGDAFPGGGVYHIERPSPITQMPPVYVPPVPQYAAPPSYWPPQPPPS
jgi:RsiW-degrading membrane proteinase PrsW (M82 family)